ncbi:acyl-CoA thioesterase-1 [Arthrobacter woluwensis]|uniref:SGNH/GDSL hydrolase family protein n=1 Tax=Arthrobacter woluwensis TaxID=156980 RepID=UPI0027822B6D|nr:SGNH/GDSL hydrolase family protein [Arthrobacter woluwensis]MDQ0708369.1 acyl-CoA thioesterase-1 [Arthrobacter woluwensis]
MRNVQNSPGQQRASSRRAFLLLAVGGPVATLLGACGTSAQAATRATPAPPGQSNVVIIGDSLSTGFGTSPEQAWPTLLSQRFTTQEPSLILVNGAQNGSGYVTTGSEGDTFGAEVQRYVNAWTRTVLFFGSDNDLGEDPPQIKQAALAALQDVRLRAPHARRIVVGPPAYSADPDQDLLAIRDALKAAAEASSAEFVDPIALDWMASQADALLGPDGEHPSPAGHVRLADLMGAVLGLTTATPAPTPSATPAAVPPTASPTPGG